MKLPKRYQDAKNFANACIIEGISPMHMAELAVLAERVFRGCVKEANIKDYSADPARQRFLAAANKLNLEVDFGNPYPSCAKDGFEVRIPILS